MFKKSLSLLLALCFANVSVFAQLANTFTSPNEHGLSQMEVDLLMNKIDNAVAQNNKIFFVGIGAGTLLSGTAVYASYIYYKSVANTKALHAATSQVAALATENAAAIKSVASQATTAINKVAADNAAAVSALSQEVTTTLEDIITHVNTQGDQAETIGKSFRSIKSALRNHAKAINANAENFNAFISSIQDGSSQLAAQEPPRRPIGYNVGRTPVNPATDDIATNLAKTLKTQNAKLPKANTLAKAMQKNLPKTAVKLGVIAVAFLAVAATVKILIEPATVEGLVSNDRAHYTAILVEVTKTNADFFAIAAKDLYDAKPQLVSSIIAENPSMGVLLKTQVGEMTAKSNILMASYLSSTMMDANNDAAKIHQIKLGGFDFNGVKEKYGMAPLLN